MTDDPGTVLAAGLALVVTRLARALESMQPDDLPFSEAAVLADLETGSGASLTELAVLERMAKPSMFRHLRSLESRGLVSRDADKADGRRVPFSLTPLGREVLHRAFRDSWLTGRIGRLSLGDRGMLHDALPVLAKLAKGDSRPAVVSADNMDVVP